MTKVYGWINLFHTALHFVNPYHARVRNTELYFLAFYISIGVTTLTMFFLGFFQAIISHQNPFYNGFIVMITKIYFWLNNFM